MFIDTRGDDTSFDRRYTVDCAIVGGGLIGMAIALEMQRRGATVVVVEQSRSLAGASIAAAGMLAVDDPHNPVAIMDFARMSALAYPSFLRRIGEFSGIQVPFQTDITLQYMSNGVPVRLSEHSLDPRELADSLHLAVSNTPITVLDNTVISACCNTVGGSRITTAAGAEILAKTVVYAAGAWTTDVLTAMHGTSIPVAPRKGQMLRVRLPASLPLREVHRNKQVYIVPRLVGHQAGSMLIGATVEDAGFDMALRVCAIARLRALAAGLLPCLASETEAPLVESWTGLRPCTPDFLPIIGEWTQPGHFIASGHYRNGILLAPGTATVVADLIEGKQPSVDIAAFSPRRFSAR